MLNFIATPIGSLKEITYLAVEKLSEADCIYAENPRHSLTLLNHYNIKKPVFEYFKFNENKVASEIISKLNDGLKIAIISDAGTPLISDPGDILRQSLIKNNLPFSIVGSTSACISALVLSGLDCSNFYMAGFLPNKNKQRQEKLAELKNLKSTLIFYVAVHDIKKDLEFLHAELGNRKVALVREISKKFEQVLRFNLGETVDITAKGEFVLVVEGASEETKEVAKEEIIAELKTLIKKGVSKKEAAKLVASKYGLVSREVYEVAVAIKI